MHYIRAIRKSLKSQSLYCIWSFIPSRLLQHIYAEYPSIVSDQGVSTVEIEKTRVSVMNGKVQRTPWFQESQSLDTPTSKLMPNANAPAKMEVT